MCFPTIGYVVRLSMHEYMNEPTFQAAATADVYKLVGFGGDGELVNIIRRSNADPSYQVDEAITEVITRYLYNNGSGKLVRLY